MEKKLTDEEIVKAFEHCVYKARDKGCLECAYAHTKNGDITCSMKQMRIDTLDLIHRLQKAKEFFEKGYEVTKKIIDEKNEKICRLEEEIELLKDKNAKQQAEIERLTEENGYLDGCAKQFLADYQKCEMTNSELQELNAKYYNEAKDLRRENAELQKQVDELTAFKNEVKSTSLYGIGRRHGKAVANAIWLDITSYYVALRVLGNATVELDKLAEFWHKYGVEVE